MKETEFGKRLRQVRRAQDISQEELALRIGTSKQVISRYEIGARVPKINVASEFARILGVPVDYLLGNTDDPRLPEEIMGTKNNDEILKVIENVVRRMTDVERRRMINLMHAAFDYLFEDQAGTPLQ